MDSKTFNNIYEDSKMNRLTFMRSPSGFLTDYLSDKLGTYRFSQLFESIKDYLTSIKYIPIDLSKFGTFTQEPINIGKKSLDKYATFRFKYDNPVYKKLFTTEITRRFYPYFLNYPPYTRLYLYIPYFPLVELDLNRIYNKQISCYINIDVFTGTLAYYLYTDDNNTLIATASRDISITLPLGRTNAEEINRNNFLQSISFIGSIIGLGVGVASGNPLVSAGSVGLMTKNITTGIMNNVNHLSGYNGGNGNRTELCIDKQIKLIWELPKNIHVPDESVVGVAVNYFDSLSGYTGYTQIGEINFTPNDSIITKTEIDLIIEQLRSGVIL